MTITTTITDSHIFQALGEFLKHVLPANVAVVQGQQNRVAAPSNADAVVMWSLRRERIALNSDSYNDVAFIGSISAAVLTVTSMIEGSIVAGGLLEAEGVLADTTILSQLSGVAGGAGTYSVSKSQTLASTTMQTGLRSVLQPVKVTIQVDAHGPHSADNAQIISTLLRDEYGVEFFAGESIGALGIQPLFTSDPRQNPFMNGEQQAEQKWTVEVTLQANPVVAVQQDFAGEVNVGSITNVDTYPV